MRLILRSREAASRRMGCIVALMVRDAQRRAPHHEEYTSQRTSFLRPYHHRPRFQLTQIVSARLRPIAEPNRSAAMCNTAIAMPSPINPPALLASTAAFGGPPMRGCRISIMLVNTTGNSAMMPLILGPTQPDPVTTVATSVETSKQRKGISYQRRVISGILTWGERLSNGTQIAKATAFAIRPAVTGPCTERMTEASAIHTATAVRQLTIALWRCASAT